MIVKEVIVIWLRQQGDKRRLVYFGLERSQLYADKDAEADLHNFAGCGIFS
jgi:hypothetical protein